jgi:hypothetical protein
MEEPDLPDELTSAEDEVADAAFDRELAQRLEEELREDEEQLEDDIKEEVVAESEPDQTPGDEAAELSVFASLEERTAPTRVEAAAVGHDEGDFVCRSCFLVKRRTQLVDPDRLLCVDCART